MGKSIEESPPKRDDPIFKKGPTIYTPRSVPPPTKPKPSKKDADE